MPECVVNPLLGCKFCTPPGGATCCINILNPNKCFFQAPENRLAGEAVEKLIEELEDETPGSV